MDDGVCKYSEEEAKNATAAAAVACRMVSVPSGTSRTKNEESNDWQLRPAIY